MFALVGFGVLGTAPISPYRMLAQNRRYRWLAAVAAGPVSNLLLAIVAAMFINLLLGYLGSPAWYLTAASPIHLGS